MGRRALACHVMRDCVRGGWCYGRHGRWANSFFVCFRSSLAMSFCAGGLRGCSFLPGVGGVSLVRYLCFTWLCMPGMSVSPLRARFAGWLRMVSCLVEVTLVLPFTGFVVRSGCLIVFCRRPIQTFERTFARRSVRFVRSANKAVVPDLCLLHLRWFFRATSRLHHFLPIGRPNWPVAFSQDKGVFQHACPTRCLVRRNAILPPNVVRGRSFPVRTWLWAVVQKGKVRTTRKSFLRNVFYHSAQD